MYELWVNIPPAAPHYGCWMVGICSDTNHLTRSKLYLDQLPLSPFTELHCTVLFSTVLCTVSGPITIITKLYSARGFVAGEGHHRLHFTIIDGKLLRFPHFEPIFVHFIGSSLMQKHC